MESIEMDAYLVDTLMPDLVGHDRQPAAFLVYLYLWRQTQLCERSTVKRSLREISEGTGISKRATQTALKRLSGRRLVSVQRDSITAVPEYRVRRPWSRGAQ